MINRRHTKKIIRNNLHRYMNAITNNILDNTDRKTLCNNIIRSNNVTRNPFTYDIDNVLYMKCIFISIQGSPYTRYLKVRSHKWWS